jgi:phospholipase/carboxylesterase
MDPMDDPLLETLDLDPKAAPKASIIWLHGLGASMHDFEPLVPELQLPESMAIRFVFPNAPNRPVTVNGGMVMRAWYDILGLEMNRTEDAAGIRASEASVRMLIERERSLGIPTEKIVVAGFSQGGAIALQTGLRYPERLAGILALSTYIPLAESFKGEASEANRETAVLMAHGESDPVIPITYARASRRLLEDEGYAVEWHDYPMQHAVCGEEVLDIANWLKKTLA